MSQLSTCKNCLDDFPTDEMIYLDGYLCDSCRPDPERGECDKCEETYDIGSQLDHCTECGTCWSHCDCLSDA